MEKKLITTNENICNYDFYRECNISFLSRGFSVDKAFLYDPYFEIPEKIKNQYRIDYWVERLLSE